MDEELEHIAAIAAELRLDASQGWRLALGLHASEGVAEPVAGVAIVHLVARREEAGER